MQEQFVWYVHVFNEKLYFINCTTLATCGAIILKVRYIVSALNMEVI